MVYLIVCFKNNCCKIGSSLDPSKRLNNLQSANPNKLELVSIIEGDKKLEFELHEKFSKDRLNGEWFNYTKEIKEYFGEIYQIKMFDNFTKLLMLSEKSEIYLFSYFLKHADGTTFKLGSKNQKEISSEVNLQDGTIRNILPQMVDKGYFIHLGRTTYCINPFVAFRGTDKARLRFIDHLVDTMVLNDSVFNKDTQTINNKDIYYKII